MSRDEIAPARSSGLKRRDFLRTALLGAGGIVMGSCQPPAPAASPSGGAATSGQSAPAAGAPPTAQQAWDALVAAAKQEGRLILHGPPTPETRQQIPAAFQARFGIPVEYISLRTSELAPKMVAEQQAGLVTIDAMVSGIASFADVLYPGACSPTKNST